MRKQQRKSSFVDPVDSLGDKIQLFFPFSRQSVPEIIYLVCRAYLAHLVTFASNSKKTNVLKSK